MKISYPLRDLQQEAPVGKGACGCELYHGDFLAEWEGKMLCPDCWKAEVERMLREDPVQLALELELEVEQCL